MKDKSFIDCLKMKLIESRNKKEVIIDHINKEKAEAIYNYHMGTYAGINEAIFIINEMLGIEDDE